MNAWRTSYNRALVIADLRAFFARPTVIELFVAFVLALAWVDFVTAVVDGLVYTPITQRVSAFAPGHRSFEFVIGNRVFDTAGILTSGIVLAVVVLGSAYVVRDNQDALWQDEGEFVDCPHCLSTIPAAATVCAECTRDVRT
jgi:large conductance mechanosensitive channel